MRRRIVRLLVVAVLALGTVIGSLPSEAGAESPTAYDVRVQFLTSEPREGMQASCVERRITLAASWYSWLQRMRFETNMGSVVAYGTERPIYLGAGNYTWSDCLTPHNGRYTQVSTLDPDNPAWATVTISYSGWDLPLSMDYEWGSLLIQATST